MFINVPLWSRKVLLLYRQIQNQRWLSWAPIDYDILDLFSELMHVKSPGLIELFCYKSCMRKCSYFSLGIGIQDGRPCFWFGESHFLFLENNCISTQHTCQQHSSSKRKQNIVPFWINSKSKMVAFIAGLLRGNGVVEGVFHKYCCSSEKLLCSSRIFQHYNICFGSLRLNCDPSALHLNSNEYLVSWIPVKI